MYLSALAMRNFRNLRSTELRFRDGVNTIIGENDSGKTNAVTALRLLFESPTESFNKQHLSEHDFPLSLGDWRGHWIILQARFDGMAGRDLDCEPLAAAKIPDEPDNISPKSEQEVIAASLLSQGPGEHSVTLIYRPRYEKRRLLHESKSAAEFTEERNSITLDDYECIFTAGARSTLTSDNTYQQLVGSLTFGNCAEPDAGDDHAIIGAHPIQIADLRRYIALNYVDALRDTLKDLRSNRSPLRTMFSKTSADIGESDRDQVTALIAGLNSCIGRIPQVRSMGTDLQRTLYALAGLIYAPQLSLMSSVDSDLDSLAHALTLKPDSPYGQGRLEQLGLGHLNLLYTALHLNAFEVAHSSKHSTPPTLNLLIFEEPEAHLHTHIQKTVFANLNSAQNCTQVILTTHSTHLCSVADISRVNVMQNSPQGAQASQPGAGLEEFARLHKLPLPRGLGLTDCLHRYLDAKRSVLLFSKGVLLVEGDGEEILIPALVKAVLGVSLDEIGIGLINIGSVGFHNVAPIFADERLHRHCAILTDSDEKPGISGTDDKTGPADQATVLGRSRRETLGGMFPDGQPWVRSFFARFTLEVDFALPGQNRVFIRTVADSAYVKANAKDSILAGLSSDESAEDAAIKDLHDSVLRLARHLGKGWYATQLATQLDRSAVIPEYIMQGIGHAARAALTPAIIRRMLDHLEKQPGANISPAKSSNTDSTAAENAERADGKAAPTAKTREEVGEPVELDVVSVPEITQRVGNFISGHPEFSALFQPWLDDHHEIQ